MDFTSLFNGSDNLFKYLFLGGLVSVILSLFYPLQKEQELQIEVINFEKELNIYRIELKVLSAQLDKYGVLFYKNKSGKISFKEIEQMNKMKPAIRQAHSQVNLKNVFISYTESRISVLKQQFEIYKWYGRGMLCIGVVLMAIGGICWYRLMPFIYKK